MTPEWTRVITPPSGPVDLRLPQLWRSRELIGTFVWRDFVASYQQTILGPVWHLVTPVLTTLVFTVVFGRVIRLPSDGLPPFLFYLVGNLVWSYFAGCLTGIAATFTTNASLYNKVYFHRLTIPISLLVAKLIGFSIQFLVVLAAMACFAVRGEPIRPNAWLLAFPICLVISAFTSFGVGMVLASATTRYKDLIHVIGFGVQLMQFATPIIYPLSAASPETRAWLLVNPLTPVLETVRHGLTGAGSVQPGWILVAIGTSTLLALTGLICFGRVERSFMDTI